MINALIILYVFVACENREPENTTVNLAFKTHNESFYDDEGDDDENDDDEGDDD